MIDATTLRKCLAPLMAVALRSFALTALAMLLLGLLLAGVSYHLASEASALRGVLAALVAFLACVGAGLVVAGQRAVAVVLLRGLRSYQLGDAAVGIVFDRLLGVTAQAEPGGMGGAVARAAERLPLAQAEARLNEAVAVLLRASADGGGLSGWVRRRVHGKLLSAVRQYTLARFRQEGAEHGGIDLLKVRADLGRNIDSFMLRKMRGIALRWTVAVVVAAIVVSLAGAGLLRQL